VTSIKKDPLRALTGSERRALEQLARSPRAPAASVARARAFLAVSDGSSYTEAARLVGRAVGDSMAQWVARFKSLIEQAYTQGERLGLAVWGLDEAGPYQAIPQPGMHWQPVGQPARYPPEHVRHGTCVPGSALRQGGHALG
jgi:hypothetical protein